MRIAVFYEHAFEPGGAPIGIRHLVHGLSRAHDVTLWGKNHPLDSPLLRHIQCRRYTGLRDLYCQLPGWIERDRPEALLLVGFFLLINVPVARLARRHGVPVILHPLAQVWDEAFQGKIFTDIYDVRRLEAQAVNKVNARHRLAGWLNPYLKKGFKYTAGHLLAQQSTGVAVLSKTERRQFLRHYPAFTPTFLPLPWGIDTIETPPRVAAHYYRDVLGCDAARPNFIVWSRLDWYYKGLDRLLEGVRVLQARLGGGKLPFRLYLSGPDYRAGSVQAARYIAAHGLEHSVALLLPGSYEPGSKAPLQDADASILLSRWDGSPRALRESLYYGRPVLVSQETNFAELVRATRSGLIVKDADDAEEVAGCLAALTEERRRARYAEGAMRLAQWLDWHLVADRFATDLGKCLGLTANASVTSWCPHTVTYAEYLPEAQAPEIPG